MKRVYCLYRVSTKQQVDVVKDDIPMQKEACRQFAEKQGWVITKEFYEKGVSGSKVSAEKRDAIQNLKKAALNDEFDILLVFMFDRLGRIDKETPFVVEWFVENGIEMWSTQEGQQRIENHGDKLMNYVRYWQASGETQKMSVRISTRIGQLTTEGIFNGGAPGYGYKLVRGMRKNKKGIDCCGLAVNEQEAEIVKLIFEKTISERIGSHRLAMYLNEQGLRTQNGAKWQSININRILGNEIYLGIYHRSDKSAPVNEKLIIIDQRIFAKAQEVLRERTKKKNQKNCTVINNKSRSLMSGKIICAGCGGRLSPSSYVDKYKLADGTEREYRRLKYYCYNKSRKRECHGAQTTYLGDKIDHAVLDCVRRLLSQIVAPTEVEIIKRRIENRLCDAKKEKQKLQESLRNSELILENLHLEIIKSISGESVFTESDIAASIKLQKESMKDFKTKISVLEEKISENGYDETDLKELHTELIGWSDGFNMLDTSAQKDILSKFLKNIVVYSYEKILVYINPSYSQFCSDSDVVEISADDY